MKNNRVNYIRKILSPCVVLSAIAGTATGVLISLFKFCSSLVISYSEDIYSFVRENVRYLPLLLIGAALIGIISALILKFAPNCKGGGIPTAIAELRGAIKFSWIKNIFVLFPSAMLTYLCGVPLGNEGPSVQMGTAVGRGTVKILSKKVPAWDRYIMTGGACAGFAAATGAPLTGILFAFEEAHRRFSPLLFTVAATAVCTGSVTARACCKFLRIDFSFLNISIPATLPVQYIWIPAVIGLVCGICAVLFTKFYYIIKNFLDVTLKEIPFTIKIVLIFVLTAIIGYMLDDCISSGHSLIHELLEGNGIPHILIIVLLMRAILLLLANNAGITGGLFVPTLTFGAIISAVIAWCFESVGAVDTKYHSLMIVIGMVAFLAAASRTPLTAISFALETMCGMNNIIFVVIGVTVSFLVIETLGVTAFNDTVIESKIKAEHSQKTPHVIDSNLTVGEGAFVIGKEIRDILWPPTCTVLSVIKNNKNADTTIAYGDILHVHYLTYSPKDTADSLFDLVGKQTSDIQISMRLEHENENVPEN